jgi:DNA helicase-2/ATP-dependent DNA helicase PcrA
MVIAGAGSGKTRMITCRIAHLIREKGIAPDNILAITFTNKAAKEMQERVRQLLGHTDSPPWVSTFHSFCLRLLRQHIGALGFSKDFVICDGQDQLSLIKQCMKSASMNEDAFPPKSILNIISGFKNDFLLPKDIKPDNLPYGNKLKAAQVYPLYQEELKKNNALDFDDMLIMSVRLLREVETVFQYYSNRFRYIMVDEFQDTNEVQYQLVHRLSRVHGNVCAVGDDDQSIYRWRGANLENMLNFEEDFPGTAVIKLEEISRSTKNILAAAGAVVKENTARRDKTLWTRNEAGDLITYYKAEDEDDEARTVCEKIVKLNREEGFSFNDMAVLYRTNAQSRVVEDWLRRMSIPYQIVGGLRFYERKEIKDILAFMRVTLNPSDAISLQRIINVPPRGIGKTSIDKVEAYCAEAGIPLLEGFRQAMGKNITTPATAKKIGQFVAMLDRLTSVFQNSSPIQFLDAILEQTGYSDMLQKDATLESRGRLENLKELYSAVGKFSEDNSGSSLREFLDSVTLFADMDNLDDSRGVVPLMTLHTCKGLEFHVVFIIGMENNLLPHQSSMSSNEEFEEERRLCYVGFTRARKKLFLTNARRRRIYGSTFNYRPSDFLLSIPAELLDVETSTQSYAVSEPRQGRDMEHSSLPPGKSSRETSGTYSIGTKVLHPTFGAGVIVNKEGNEDNLKLDIFFKGGLGKKKVAVNYVNLIVL